MFLDENGFITATGLLFVTVLTLLGVTSAMMTTTDLMIGSNYKTSVAAFYAAEAGVEEARARLRGTAGANLISDTNPTDYSNDPEWHAYIGSLENARAKGFDPYNNKHTRVDSLQGLILDPKERLNFTVQIRHKSKDGKVLYTGGQNIYVITSSGTTGTSEKSIEIETSKIPSIKAPAPLYVKGQTKLLGASTTIIGKNSCGGPNKPGVLTTQDPSSVDQGQATITVEPPDPKIQQGGNLDLEAMIASLKGSAYPTYNVSELSDQHWGQPVGGTKSTPSSCSEYNIVYFNTNIKLTGQSSGCGILLVDGDLSVHGGFSWYGVILATGTVTFVGGGQDSKQVTGGILSGANLAADLNNVGGNTSIIYCSSPSDNPTGSFPLRILSWRDL